VVSTVQLGSSATKRRQPRRRLPERELVRRCLAHDPEAWRALYVRHFGHVATMVERHAADADFDDLCQEIFLIVFRHLRTFRGEGRLRAWIERLAAREAIRSAKRVRSRAQGATSLRAARTRRAQGGEAGELRYVAELLDRLPVERRAALVAFELEGRPVEEIAETAGCAVNTVWTRIHRARSQLKELVREGNT
jgi:RNA polymerase sigma-70 factor, ECF subfamily